MNIAYDYSELIKEFTSDCIELGILATDEIRIIRKIRKDISYKPIIDYLLPDQFFLENELNEEDILLESVTANDFINEMTTYNSLI